ncbi:MAG: methyltransferase domain-containing protein [Rhodobacteraceae bacterium]|nr:methyltransferase domain-containing protein [Alphaproteobacteria bacterium]NNF70949.1 methyltransferase domain-containing protein [Paracoccaceae bacterium]NNK67140.1 methyltransferase domain-containing protein [Paracoccaceae bacterium]
MTQTGVEARKAALDLIDAVTVSGEMLSEALPRVVRRLEPADRARVQRLATETLRWASRSDRALGPYLRKRPEPRTHNMLRMAVYEICAEGMAAHGVVNSAVTILNAMPETKRQSGLANAVLRKIATAGIDWDGLPLPVLPKWLRKPLVADFGKDVVAAMEAAHCAPVPIDLTPRDGDAAALAKMVDGHVLPTGSVRLHGQRHVSELPGFGEGAWWVQDAAAAIPASVLDPQPGERVLDLCAAPGGKTLQLAAAGADVTAVDVSERRVARLHENLARTRLAADVVVADALEWRPDTHFDAILLDAPCSATGTLRRHPDLPFAKDGSEFPALFALQIALIDAALEMLKPGGRLVYCTCSLLIDEGEEQLRDALDRHPALVVEPAALERPGIDPGWIGEEGGLRLRPDYWPDLGGMDGFFIAQLRKPADA